MQTPPNNSHTKDDDEQDMHSAFQQFMLSGSNRTEKAGGKKKKKGRQQNNIPPLPTPPGRGTPGILLTSPGKTTLPSPSSGGCLREHQRAGQEQKIRKRYLQILMAFRKTLQEDWIDVDDHLGQVIASIVNLRDRIRMSSKHLGKWKQGVSRYPSSTAATSAASSIGEGLGYRCRPQRSEIFVLGRLTQDDVELALNHGLIQHEKMLAGARRLMASLNQAQETLGRRLDELYMFHLEASPLFHEMDHQAGEPKDDDASDPYQNLAMFAGNAVLWSRQVYTELAQELYRKQCLVQVVVDSVNDDLFYQEDEDLDDEATPGKVAEKCLHEWPRGSSSGENRLYLAELLSSTPWE